MTAEQLQSFLEGRGIWTAKCLIADDLYSLPTREWFLGKFARAFGRLLWAAKLVAWIQNRFDCDDFARLAAALAGILHKLSSKQPTGLAVGEFWYQRAGGDNHAIAVAIVEEAGDWDLVFMEPQTQRELKLTEEEIQSCIAYRF